MASPYHKNNPFFATITERYSLCLPGSEKETQHIVIDLKDSGINYSVGDSIAVFPTNDPDEVQRLLDVIHATGKEEIQDSRSGKCFLLQQFLSEKANISSIPRKLLQEVSQRLPQGEKKLELEALFDPKEKEHLKQFLAEVDLIDFLESHHDAKISFEELCQWLKPSLPRFYSIASSMQAVGEEVHLTVALKQWNSQGKKKTGVCSQYLCHRAPLNQSVVPVYIQPHNGFTLPQDSCAPMIMVGPGTGVAPFRAFMQERETSGSSGKNWLFFGERKRNQHYFYREYWEGLEKKGKLRLDVAFSRDQAHKVYVQHCMMERGRELFQWLQEGAYFYVCGDATCMAKDVEEALHQIVQEHGNFSQDDAKNYVKQLRKEKRYLRDVY